MSAEARALALLALSALPGALADPLPPPGHVALFIETDAPAGDDVEAADALFDTLRVELFHDEHDRHGRCCSAVPAPRNPMD